ncbi:MAG: nucleobase:cation symporter-2 family protein [Thermodesulfobacteriota bacterium]|nr:nucleobase:cation symporter-2 family protein [Thermodesulfobacteriota bacterium]
MGTTEEKQTITDSKATPFDSELIFGLDDRPPVLIAFFAAMQHMLASIVGIVTPPIIISNALGLDVSDASYIISMTLLISGIATFIQAKRMGPVGSGLLAMQGTSFAFLGPIIGAAIAIKNQADAHTALAVVFGCVMAGSFIEMFISRFLHLAQKIITPIVTGVVVTLIGLTLIKVGLVSMAGGFYVMNNVPDAFASFQNLGIAFLVLAIIVALNMSKNQYLRMSSIVIGLTVGYILAAALGMVNFSKLEGMSLFTVPQPLKYGIDFSWGAFFAIGLVYVITAIESIGDLTATSMISKQPVKGDLYMSRIKGGVLADGINSFIAGLFNTFPNTTFSQNNGVIQLTGVASRYVAYFIAGILVLMGLSPVLAGIFRIMPEPVLGGATILMFGTVATAGVKILATQKLDNRSTLIIAVSLGLGLGVTMVPEVLKNFAPAEIRNVFASGITTGGLTAIVLNLVLPHKKSNNKH